MKNKDLINDLKFIEFNNKFNKGKNISLYDYITNNYFKMSKEQLKEIIINLVYNMSEQLSRDEYLKIESNFIDDLKERL